MDLSYYAKKIPEHLIIEKCLWVGDVRVEIDHIGYDTSNPLDYKKAFKKMLDILGVEYNTALEQTKEGQ